MQLILVVRDGELRELTASRPRLLDRIHEIRIDPIPPGQARELVTHYLLARGFRRSDFEAMVAGVRENPGWRLQETLRGFDFIATGQGWVQT
jgi:hypothetical protein